MKAFIIAIDSLKKVKSADSKGIKAEDLNGVDEETTNLIHEIFNLIIKQDYTTPIYAKLDSYQFLTRLGPEKKDDGLSYDVQTDFPRKQRTGN